MDDFQILLIQIQIFNILKNFITVKIVQNNKSKKYNNFLVSKLNYKAHHSL